MSDFFFWFCLDLDLGGPIGGKVAKFRTVTQFTT